MPSAERLNAILANLRDLVAFPTAYPPGDSSDICLYLASRFKALGYETAVHSAQPGLDNLIARTGSGEPALVFNVHIDTVDAGDPAKWSSPPLEATARDQSLAQRRQAAAADEAVAAGCDLVVQLHGLP